MTDDIARWRPTIHEVRDLLDLDADQYPDAVELALIEVESAGDPTARKFDGSRYWGLLQMYSGYIKDAAHELGIDAFDAEELHGDGYRAIKVALGYFERWSRYHHYLPDRIAVLHKGGVGTADQVTQKLVDGMAVDDAIRWVEEHYTDEDGDPYAPGLFEYVRRFRAARERWAEWVAGQGAPPEVCEPVE